MPKWQGPKSGGSHTTLIDAAVPVVRAAAKLSKVKRIAPGFIKPTPGKTGLRRVDFERINGGLLVKVRGNTAIQEIRIYTDYPDEVQRLLEEKLVLKRRRS